MFIRPNVLLVSTTGQEARGTDLACHVIRRYADSAHVVGVTITATHAAGDAGSHGSPTPEARETASPGYVIGLGPNGDGDQATGRMLAAGAAQAYWLRSRMDYLAGGVGDLLSRIPRDALVVCESSCARAVLEPGAFVVVKGKGTPGDTCQELMEHADHIIESDGSDWERRSGDIHLQRGRWLVKRQATAAILAGGASRRMGRDKALMPFRGVPLIQHVTEQLRPMFAEIIVGANSPSAFGFLKLPVIPDRVPGKGPLMGILSCLSAITSDLCFITGCDVPWIDPGFVQTLLRRAPGHDIVVPRTPEGYFEPLFAVYRRSVAAAAQNAIDAGERRIAVLFDRVRVCPVEFPANEWYQNLNTPEDYHGAVDNAEDDARAARGDIRRHCLL